MKDAPRKNRSGVEMGGELGEDDAIDRLIELADYTVPFAIRIACEFRLADHLADAPKDTEQLASALDVHAPSLATVLRALEGVQVLRRLEDGCYELTRLGQLLRHDNPMSLQGAYPWLECDILAWAHLDHTVRTGEAAFELVHGQSYYQYLSKEPADSARVDASVQSLNPLIARTLVRAFPWGDFRTIVDVGSGNGAFLASLLARYPDIEGVLFDLPHVTAGATRILEDAGLADRCSIVPGDFFGAVPANGDAYILKTILHDWDDPLALAILSSIRDVMRWDSRIVVIEAVIPPGDAFDIGKILDVHSLVMARGPDRSLAQLEALFVKAGLQLLRVFETSTVLTILEVGKLESAEEFKPA